MVYMYHGISLSRKKEWNRAIFSNMNGPKGYYDKWSKSDRERQISDITYMLKLENC